MLPAALLVWAVEAYRRPLMAGMLMGLAIGVIYYPVFLLPLWLGFYWQRGLLRFSLGVVHHAGAAGRFARVHVRQPGRVLGRRCSRCSAGPASRRTDMQGFWGFDIIPPVYRFPVLVALAAFCISLALWPAQKNLGTLMSCSAAVMLGTQFWHPHGGGLYMAWYLPLVLLTIFRPNLEDRVALSRAGRRLVSQTARRSGRRGTSRLTAESRAAFHSGATADLSSASYEAHFGNNSQSRSQPLHSTIQAVVPHFNESDVVRSKDTFNRIWPATITSTSRGSTAEVSSGTLAAALGNERQQERDQKEIGAPKCRQRQDAVPAFAVVSMPDSGPAVVQQPLPVGRKGKSRDIPAGPRLPGCRRAAIPAS